MTTAGTYANQLSRQGWVVMPDLLSPDAFSKFKQGVIDVGQTRWHGVPPAEMPEHPLVREVLDTIVEGAPFGWAEMLGQQATRPSEDTFWHYDWCEATAETPLDPGTRCAIVALWALDDFTIENGPTEFLSGSHLWMPRTTTDELRTRDFLARPELQHPARALMKSGSAALFIASHLYHRAGRALVPQRRLALRSSYKGNFKGAS